MPCILTEDKRKGNIEANDLKCRSSGGRYRFRFFSLLRLGMIFLIRDRRNGKQFIECDVVALAVDFGHQRSNQCFIVPIFSFFSAKQQIFLASLPWLIIFQWLSATLGQSFDIELVHIPDAKNHLVLVGLGIVYLGSVVIRS